MSSNVARSSAVVSPRTSGEQPLLPAQGRTEQELIRLNRVRSGWNTQDLDHIAPAVQASLEAQSPVSPYSLPRPKAGARSGITLAQGAPTDASASRYELARTVEFSRAMMQDEAVRAALRNTAQYKRPAKPKSVTNTASMPLPLIRRNLLSPLLGVLLVSTGLFLLGYFVAREMPKDISRSVQAFTEPTTAR